jgi:hypothetical protein
MHFSVEVQARLPTKTAENTATSSDSQVLSALPPIQNETASARDPVMSRVTSIILQPPAVAATHSVSTPVFTHLGQQVHSMSPLTYLELSVDVFERGIANVKDQYKTTGRIAVCVF